MIEKLLILLPRADGNEIQAYFLASSSKMGFVRRITL
jgi:hypothetical protein